MELTPSEDIRFLKKLAVNKLITAKTNNGENVTQDQFFKEVQLFWI